VVVRHNRHDRIEREVTRNETLCLYFKFEIDLLQMPGAEPLFEPGPSHRLAKIYFLTFDFLVRAADP
jgi:hypothetical protein